MMGKSEKFLRKFSIPALSGKNMAMYVLRHATSSPDLFKQLNIPSEEYLQLCLSALSQSSEWLFEGSKILLEMREPIRALEWAR